MSSSSPQMDSIKSRQQTKQECDAGCGRLPSPASRRGKPKSWRRLARAVPIIEGGERGVTESATHIGVDAGQMSQVLRLAVAAVEPRENAKDFRSPLSGKRRVEPCKRIDIEIRILHAAPSHIAIEQRNLQLFRYIDAGVLKQRGDVIGRGPHHGVLEIQQADLGDA